MLKRLMMILIDTSAFLAVLNGDDPYNQLAQKVWSELLSDEMVLVVNSYILTETVALVQNRLGMTAARDFHENIKPLLQIEWLTKREHDLAMDYLLSANRRQLSLVDVSAFETMRRLGIKKVFTFDNHFAEEGFDLISAP